MENEFTKVMYVKTDDQLIKIVTIDKEDYVPMAILAATEEINRRKIDGAVIKELEENYSQERQKVQAIQSLKVEWGDRILNLIIDDIT
ncbi:MAG: hypothetical protein K2Q22_00445, partial [Cytophagales bacterium]|nr:hypothetical protein [Cytophagales bacterium]